MARITANDFSTNRSMLKKDVLRYCENYYQYLYHLVNYFGLDLNVSELRWLQFITQRIELFLKDAPTTPKYATIIGRYTRLLTKLKKFDS